MLRCGKQVGQRAAFHHPPMVHDDDLVSHVGDHAQIMGDHQDGHPQFLLEIVHQFEDLGLDGHIQRGCRFVGDQQGRAADKCHGNDRALAQAAGQFERIGGQGLLRVRKTDEAQHLLRNLQALLDVGASVDTQCL